MHKKMLSLTRHQNQSKPRRNTSTFIKTATIKKPRYGKCLQGGGRKGVLKHLAHESLDQCFSTCESQTLWGWNDPHTDLLRTSENADIYIVILNSSNITV